VAVTLIWNNKNDLDLVVLCPTGERLYYNNPRACEGALDVDRNAGKRGLTDRPVENIRWPEGRAPAGDYQVAVKYYARNDTALPPATPFQVRLLQNGRETLYQGSAIPDELKPVTTFTVER
jgi:Ca-activated chloride channel family protein